MDYMDNVSKRIVSLREEKGETQQELANAVGITRQSLSRYEIAARTASVEVLGALAQHFNVSADYLLGLSDVKSTEQDIQTACEATGLSEKAVLSLCERKEKSHIYGDMISSENFHEIAALLQELEEEKIYISHKECNFRETGDSENETKKLQYSLAIFRSFFTANTTEKAASEWIDKLIGQAMYKKGKWSDVEKLFSTLSKIIARSPNKLRTIDVLSKAIDKEIEEANNHAQHHETQE